MKQRKQGKILQSLRNFRNCSENGNFCYKAKFRYVAKIVPPQADKRRANSNEGIKNNKKIIKKTFFFIFIFNLKV